MGAIPTASALVPLCLHAVFSCRSQKGCGKGIHALQLLLLCKAHFLSAAFSSGCCTWGIMATPMQSQNPCSLQTITRNDAGTSVEELQLNGTASHCLQKAIQMILRKLRISEHPPAADLHAAQLAPKHLLALSELTRLAHPGAKSCSLIADRQRLAGADPAASCVGEGRSKISAGLREAAAEQHALLHGVGQPQKPSR